MTSDALPPSAADAHVRPFKVWTSEEIDQMVIEPTQWLVHELLPLVGTSMVGAPPKCGKSVFTRQLCAFIERGASFLGRDVRRGKTLYVSTQESMGDIVNHFRALECTRENMPAIVSLVSERIDAMNALTRVAATVEGMSDLRLLVLDMVVDVLPMRDANDYSEMNHAFAPLRRLAENRKIHICVTHHSKKSQVASAVHAMLGSSAISGGVDQVIRLTDDARFQRYIDTSQRRGPSIPRTLLTWDPELQAMSVGPSLEEERQEQRQGTEDRIDLDIYTYVRDHPGRTRPEILSAVTGKETLKRNRFNWLLNENHFSRSGGGEKGDPYTFRVSDQTRLAA